MWGVGVCGAFFQNGLTSTLPQEFLDLFPSTQVLAYSAVSRVRLLPEPLKSTVEEAFANSLRRVWLVMLVMSAIGLLSTFMMEGLPLHGSLDERWNVRSNSEERKQ